MPKLLGMRASNLGAHADLDIKFPDGLTLLKGANGSGKSTILAGLFLCLAGDHPEEGKTKSSLLAWGARKGWVELDMEAGGVVHTIHRRLDSAAATLEGGGEKVSGARLVDERLEGLLGMGRDTLLTVAFMAQRDGPDIMTAPEGRRLREWARLAGFKHAERVRERLRAAAAELPPRQPMADRVAALRRSAAESSDRMAALEAVLPSLEARAAAAGRAAAVFIPSGIKASEKALKTAEKAISLEVLRGRLAAMPPFRPVPPPVDEPSRIKALEYAEARRLGGEMLDLESRLAKAPPEAALEAACDAWRKASGERAVSEWAGKIRTSVRAGGTCPVCLSVLSADPPPPDKGKPFDPSGQQAADRALADRRALAIRSEQVGKAFYKAAGACQGFDPVSHAARESEAAKALETAYSNKARSGVEEQAAAAERACAEVAAMPSIPDDTPDTAELSRQALKAAVILTEAKSELKHLQNIRSGLLLELEEKTAWEALRAMEDAQRSFLERARSVLSPEAAPRTAASALAGPVASAVSAQLASMGAPFTLDLDGDLCPSCVFEGQKRSPRDLSGGQKALLSVAVRLALAEVLAGGVPFLVLDEPTPHLDEANREAMASALMSARDVLAASGAQIIVCSHEQEMLPAADAEIVLK